MVIKRAVPAFWITEAGDIERINAFKKQFRQEIPQTTHKRIAQLLEALEKAYRADDILQLKASLASLPEQAESRRLLTQVTHLSPQHHVQYCADLAKLLLQLRLDILVPQKPTTRLAMLDLSNLAERLLFQKGAAWKPRSPGGLLQKISILAEGCAGTGLLELWEWQRVRDIFAIPAPDGLMENEHFQLLEAYGRRVVEWATAMVRSHYESSVTLFTGFEPKASGFIDDRVDVPLP